MRELILRHAYAANKHGSFASPTLTISRWSYSNNALVQRHLRCKSTQSTTPSPSPVSSSATTPTPLRERSPRQLAQSNTVAPPIQRDGFEPEIDATRQYAVQGLVDDLTSARPPPLNLPEPPHPYAWPSKGNWDFKRWDFKYLFSLGKAYGKFYWTGVKQLYGNFKLMWQINSALSGTFPDAAARYAAVPEKISYNDYEMMMRTKRDMRKSIPFLLVFAICGEFTPLAIVLLGSRVVPGTCVIPKQELQDRKKALEKDDIYMQEMARILRTNGSFEAIQTDRKKIQEVHNLIAYRAGLTPFKTLPPVIGGLYYYFRTQKSLARQCDEILSVAVLVTREGGWAQKSPQDMWDWGNKYGLYRLRQYTRQAMARDEDPISEKMKATLLPHFEAETRNMLQEDFGKIPRTSHCTIALNSPLYHRPDIDLRRKRIEALAAEQR